MCVCVCVYTLLVRPMLIQTMQQCARVCSRRGGAEEEDSFKIIKESFEIIKDSFEIFKPDAWACCTEVSNVCSDLYSSVL